MSTTTPTIPAGVSLHPTHYHFIVWAYERVEQGTGNYIENVIIDLISESSEEALTRAKKLVKKNGYTIRSVIEHFDGACSNHQG